MNLINSMNNNQMKLLVAKNANNNGFLKVKMKNKDILNFVNNEIVIHYNTNIYLVT